MARINRYINKQGVISYKLGNLLHREDGPAVIYPDGEEWWYKNGKKHREDGPAIIFPGGTKEWWLNGVLHREDGPAVEFAAGNKIWYFYGKKVTQEEHRQCKIERLFSLKCNL